MRIKQTVKTPVTWAELKEMAETGTALYKLSPHDSLDITLEGGEYATVEVAGVIFPAEAQPPGVRFIFKNCLDHPHCMGNSYKNTGGYKFSEGRRYVLGEILPRLPADLRAVIRPRTIQEVIDGELVEYEDLLWLPSETDVYGRGDGAQINGSLPIFVSARGRIKEARDDGITAWYLRSTYYGNFWLVGSDGNATTSSPNHPWGMAPGFDL